jgi:8-amino-7-oxononanoate synthase
MKYPDHRGRLDLLDSPDRLLFLAINSSESVRTMRDVFTKCQPPAGQAEAVQLGIYPYYHKITGHPRPGEVSMGGRDVVMAGSNDYLGLSTDSRLAAAATEATERFGTGNSGSRVLNGSLEMHAELEARLAAFVGTEAAMVTTTGFQANLCLSPLLGAGDILLADQYVHASMIEAARLGSARMRRYRHNDMAHLERLLHKTDPDAGVLIFTEGMFSTTGAGR